ncbi:MAG: hypothetical protein KDC44_04260 [Phaeodactylibacter sp.]|nr:hypothetical protein [Phaeodactylibacter sp.]
MRLLLLFLLLLLLQIGFAQLSDPEPACRSSIPLTNGSFEKAVPVTGMLPMGWVNCGPAKETPPDVVQHQVENVFKVLHTAAEGQHFVSMVVRSNGTAECIQQTLDSPLLPGTSYEMTLQLALARRFDAIERRSMQEVSFAHPVMLEVYGLDTKNERILLDDIPPVNHEDWQSYTLQFCPAAPVSALIFSPFYHPDSLYEYNGHILIDNLSDIFFEE